MPHAAVTAQSLGRDSLCAIFSALAFHEQCRMSVVCSEWSAASSHLLGGLGELPLHRYAKLTDAGLLSLLRRCPRVVDVNLSGCSHITDDGVQGLARCVMLKHLNLSCLPLVAAGSIDAVCKSTPLVSLDLGGCVQVSELDLRTRFSEYLELDDDEDGLGQVQG